MEINPHLPTSQAPEGRSNGKVSNSLSLDRQWRNENSTCGVDLDRLFGRPEPREADQRVAEQPWHRFAAEMAARRATKGEIAEACNVNQSTVSQLFRNGWFQKTVIEIMRKAFGKDDIMEVFKRESFNSMVTLVELRDDLAAPKALRRQSAVDILDRLEGKPTQKVETANVTHSDDPVSEIARLEAENARLATRVGVRSEPSQASEARKNVEASARKNVEAEGESSNSFGVAGE